MERYQLMFDERGRFDPTAVSGGMWLRVGTAAAFVFVAGVVALLNGDVPPGQAVAMVLGGAAVCTFAWRRAWKILDGSPPLANPPRQDHPNAAELAELRTN